ncbi:FGGY-family carbohydrate kinase [Massilia sp. SM-13]|uniref:FGGY-family carbohydrate kinase n=1 Tax=Pseudoduganella rhizocola TaxID=3382643 RepID=UPI0038B5DF31
MSATIVLDIGKTNVKLVLLNEEGSTLAERRSPNTIVNDGPYPHHDTERIWQWLLAGLREFAQLAQVGAIVPVTHGATAALVDDEGLVLPVQDYEFEFALPGYEATRPAYETTRSPRLPAGLNLGRQLAWQAQTFPEQFRKVRHILMYPQYWAWRLCGMAASEVTSLGCHTDLWQPASQRFSSLVDVMEWRSAFPPLQPAWTPLGALRPALAAETGLPADCQVLCGIHDSNASLLRHLDGEMPPAVLSTGTWVIAAAPGVALDRLRENADMLANSSATGQPVACMRFMGGREFAALAGSGAETCSIDDLEALIAQQTLALPSFAASGGPFAGRAGAVRGPAPSTSAQRYALATLYCALVSDYCLNALGVRDDGASVVVEGSFTGNPLFAPLLAALRPHQQISISADDSSGTTCGGWMLHHWGSAPNKSGAIAAPLDIRGLRAYRDDWLKAVA